MSELLSVGQMGYYASWFLKSKVGSRRPLVNTMLINFNCNLKCKHCSISGNAEKLPSPSQMSWGDAEREMRDFYEKGARILFFEGGEPTLWVSDGKDLGDLIRLGREIGYHVVGYTTNGTTHFFEESDVISVSLDGPREVHDEIRGTGVFDKLMSNLEGTNHPNIFANMTIMQQNKDEVRRTAEIVKGHNHIRGLMLNFITPPPQDIALSLKEKSKVVEEALRLKKEGYPILNTTKALRELLKEDYGKECPHWVSAFVLPDCSHYYGCPMENTEACKQCGFDAVREYRLITKGNVSAIREMSKRFAYSKP
ncbi:MAG: radical SAM protein [Methanomassiliicoccales archaeon]|nr:radical SAM protein [Methanomassiliicoccales archaeon]